MTAMSTRGKAVQRQGQWQEACGSCKPKTNEADESCSDLACTAMPHSTLYFVYMAAAADMSGKDWHDNMDVTAMSSKG